MFANTYQRAEIVFLNAWKTILNFQPISKNSHKTFLWKSMLRIPVFVLSSIFELRFSLLTRCFIYILVEVFNRGFLSHFRHSVCRKVAAPLRLPSAISRPNKQKNLSILTTAFGNDNFVSIQHSGEKTPRYCLAWLS